MRHAARHATATAARSLAEGDTVKQIRMTVILDFTDHMFSNYAEDFDLQYWNGAPVIDAIKDHVSSWVASDLEHSTTGCYASVTVAHVTADLDNGGRASGRYSTRTTKPQVPAPGGKQDTQ